MTRFQGLGLRRPCLFLVALCAVTATQALADDDPLSCPPVIYGCGKAQALTARFIANDEPFDSPAPREAMTETDVLSYALDVELTNISTAAGSCTITGTNVVTIQSKSAGLTQFTFRLR